jgi:hypothetical protein
MSSPLLTRRTRLAWATRFLFLAGSTLVAGSRVADLSAQSAPSDMQLVVPAASETLHVSATRKEPTEPQGGGPRQLAKIGCFGTAVPAQLAPAAAPDGTTSTDHQQLLAVIPPQGKNQAERLFVLQPAVEAPSDPDGNFRFEPTRASSIGLWEGEAPVLVYNHGVVTNPDVPETDHRRRRACYIHPVYGLNGEVLTEDFPRDHYHHHGVFWTWPHVKVGDEEHDLWAGDTIDQRFVRWLARAAGPVAAVLGVENGWFVGEKQVMIERLWLRIYRRSPHCRSLDIALVLIPTVEPVALLGAAEKSYGGLTMRFAPPSGSDPSTMITVPSGRIDGDVSVTRFPWADYTSKLGGRATPSGAAIFIHPRHPDYPPTWLLRHYGPLCVGWPGVVSRTLPPGEPVRLEYRIWIHDAVVDADHLAQAYTAYQKASDVRWRWPDDPPQRDGR